MRQSEVTRKPGRRLALPGEEESRALVNRSQRRAMVIAWTIAAAATCTGVLGAGPAAADGLTAGGSDRRAGDDAPATADRPGTRATGGPHRRSATADERRSVRQSASVRAVRVTAAVTPPKHHPPKPHWHPVLPCPHEWPVLSPAYVRAEADVSSGGLLLVNALGLANTINVAPPVFGPSATRAVLGVAADPEPESAPADVAGPSGPAPAGVPPAATAPAPPAAPPQTRPERSRSADRPAAEPLEQPKAQGPLDDRVRLGYPDRLRYADLPEVAALALPGLAAILGFTAAGGFLGYRQARAGSALLATGTARFLP